MLLLIPLPCLMASQLQAETLPGEVFHRRHCLLQLSWVLVTSHLKLPAPWLPHMPPLPSCKRVQHGESIGLLSIIMQTLYDLISSLIKVIKAGSNANLTHMLSSCRQMSIAEGNMC